MKIVTFTENHRTRLGVLREDGVVDLATHAPQLPHTMISFLRMGPAAMEEARAAADKAASTIPLARCQLLAPVPRPTKVLAIGLNYADHVREGNRALPEHQVWFAKQPTSIIGPGAPIVIPSVSEMIDFEGELAYVIGRRARKVPKERAHEVIAGFMIGNDISVRDWQQRSPTMMMGKGFDTHGPIGPWLVTPDEVGDFQNLTIRTWVNGSLMQNGSTAEMIFGIREQIEHLSAAFTLEPGDVIFTGTPAGVGVARKPPVFLKPGDVVRIEIDQLGALENPCIADTVESFIV
ncbi:MAG TPA: 5-carboxymethyl-2-hydroxymuconate isomerase [Alphaproteobacteria bacterium]|nr:5-carboxymethyl-2-hydroxymuconate isomerase [Alphaproteobacteria bacterium]